MTIREMHIEFDVLAQKIMSEHYDTFRPQEKDWLINKATRRLIKQRYSKVSNRKQEGLTDTFKRAIDVERMVVRATLPAYIRDGKSTFSILPDDFFLPVNHRTSVMYNCNGVTRIPVNSSFQTATIVVNDDATEPESYKGFAITATHSTLGVVNLFDTTSFTALTNGLNETEEKYYFINLALEEINSGSSGIKAAWYKSGQLASNGAFVFTDHDGNYVDITLTLRTGTDTTVVFLNAGYSQYTTNSLTVPLEHAARVADNELLYKMLDHPFQSTKYNSVLLSYQDDLIVAHINNTFNVEQVLIEYIKTPQRADLLLGRDCPLHPTVHEEVVDLAVQMAKAYIASEDYQLIINENLLNE
jgi:hypothetical protein